MDTMPSVPMAVSLSDILEVRGEPLREREVWALLCQSAAAIQDFFIKGASGKKDGTSFVINPMTLTVCRDGQVSLTPGNSTWHGSDYKAPECCSEVTHMLSDTATEKIFLYTLGKTLQVATEYGLCKNEFVGVSTHLDSLLEAMCEKNPAVRIGLRSILEACDLHTRQHPEKTPYAQTICDLYSSVLGPVDQIGMDSSHISENSQQRVVTSRSRRRPHLPYHLHCDEHGSPSCSPTPTRSRSRSPSHKCSRGTEDSVDDSRSFVKPSKSQTVKKSSSPPIKLNNSTSLPSSTAPTGIFMTTRSGTIRSRRLSPQDPNLSFASSVGDHTSLYHSAPAYQAFLSMPGSLSLNMGNPAYEKYLQLKERRHRLKTAKTGEQAESELVGNEGFSAAHPIPLFHGTWRGDMDYMTDTHHSLASLMSYTPGSCMPELSLLDTHPTAPVVHGDLNGGSLLSRDLSVLMPVAAQTPLNQQNHSLPEELKQPHALPETPASVKRQWEDDTPEEQQKRQSDRYRQPAQEVTRKSCDQLQKPPQQQQHPHEEHLSNQHSSSHMPLLKEQSVPSQGTEVQQQQLECMHQFGSRDLTPTPDALPVKEYYGPEFVHRASLPVIRMSLPLQGESIKNPALARRIVIVHLTGQKFEAIVDPCMTSRQLFDAVVTHTALDDFSFFGLTCIYEGEHFFLDADTKLHKVAPEGWRERAKGHMPPVTFTLYLRVKFYPDSLSDFRHLSSHHLLYLQLRHDVLEERCMTNDQQLLALSGLALHAEFGDYSRRTMGHNYFVPEQYLSPRVARRLGMGYVHDQALEAHRDALGLAPSQCEIQFIKMVQKLPEYGIHFYRLMKGKNDTSNLVWVGITQTSLLIAEQSGSQRTVMQALSWPAILKISFNKRRFSVQPKVDSAAHKAKPPKISFFTNSYRKGRYLLQLSTAQHRFHIHMRTLADAMENTHATAALESLGGELEEWQSKKFSPEGEGAEEEDNEKEEGLQILTQQSVETCIGSAERAPLDSPGKQLASPENGSVEPEERDEAPPVKYRSPPSYHPNLDCLMDQLSADNSVHAQDRIPMTAASSDKIASVNFGIIHGREQMTILHADAVSPLADQISSPQLSKQFANLSPHDHPPSHHHGPTSHLASGQPSLGRQITEVTLQKEGDKGIGITIVGGETTSSLDLGIFVKSVMKHGPAARTGQIQAGDRLIAINNISLEGVQHHEAVQLIRQSIGSVRLLVSQMQPPVTIKHKLSGTNTRVDNDIDAVNLFNDDLENDSHVPSDHPNNILSACNTAGSRSYHLPVHQSYFSLNSSDLVDDAKMELVKKSASECLVLLELDNNSVSADARDEMLLSEEMLAATELDSQDYGPGNIGQTLKAEMEFDKEVQELHILGEIVNMTVANSDTDSDFESAVQATVEEKVTKSFSCKTSEDSSPLRKGISISSPDTVVYEVVLEKEQGELGIIISEGDENNIHSVQSLVPGGPAESGGILQPGDSLMELNGQSMSGITSSDLEKALQSAPDICLLKVGRTKSLDDLVQEQLPEQFNKGHGSLDQHASAVSGEASWDDLAVPESQLSLPSAFASVASTPVKDVPAIPVLPPPQLTFDLPRVEDEHSNNTQSDVDSDVLDSSRSEMEYIYRSADNYFEDDQGGFELDDVVNMESMSVGVDKSENGVETQRNVHSSRDVYSDSSCQGGHCGANGNLSFVETLHTSPPTVCSVDGSVLHLAWKSQSKSLVRQEHVTETFKERNNAASDEQTSDNDQVQEFTVELKKSAGRGLGFTVVGGVSTLGGCYVKAVVQDPALSDGRLRAGDRLIQVNGQDMTGLSHFEAVTFLRQTPKEVSIMIQRYNHTDKPFMNSPHETIENGPPNKIQHFTGSSEQVECYTEKSHNADPDEISSESVLDQQQASTENKECQLPVKNLTKCGNTPKAVIRPYTYGQQHSCTQDRAKTHTTELSRARAETNTGVVRIVLDKLQPSDSLGFSLIQCRMDCGQTGIFIKTLTPGGIAQTEGHLRVGDQLLQVKEESLIGCSHTKAVRLLREASGSVVLIIFRYSEEQPDSSETTDLTRDTSHLISEGPSTLACSSDSLSDDDINDILDEPINFLNNPRTLKSGSRMQDLPIRSKARELNTLGQVEQNMPTSIKQTEFHSESNTKTSDCSASKFSLPPLYGEVSGLLYKAQGSHGEAAEIKILRQRGYVRKVSSVEIPEDLTTSTLLSLPIMRMRIGTEERTMQLLQLLADAVEQEEPLLEFEKLRLMKATDNMEVAKLPENKTRNRYRNVLPYDYNRVKLHTSNPEDNDYINASDVQLSVKDKEDPLCYIACQGPLMVTQGHFWQMVWETGASVVVMLTQEIESGKVKCHRYWPQVHDEPLDLCSGKYSVQLAKEQKLEDFDIRYFRLHNHDSGEERRVVHLHYTTWPDHGVPDSACPLLQFVRLMHQLHQNGPFVVHCSAGIGRSGVLMAVDTALAHIETGDGLDLFDIVSELRHQRYGMIQTQDQYLFCYTACMEALLSKEK